MAIVKVTGFQVEEENGRVVFSCDVSSSFLPPRLYFKVSGTQLAVARGVMPNWAAVALLYPAMKLGHTLVIEAAISPGLLFNLNNDVVPLLKAYNPALHAIEVRAESGRDETGQPTGRVATGFSAGVDSFATLAMQRAPGIPSSLRVTDLAVFNVGAMSGKDATGTERLFAAYTRRCESFGASCGLGANSVDSNLDDFYLGAGRGSGFIRTHSIRAAAAALLFEGVFDRYLYGSSFSYAFITVADTSDISAFDPILLPLVSTERLQLAAIGTAYSRVEKTRMIAGMPEAHRLLDVCLSSPVNRLEGNFANCSRCYKCQRTMITLDAMGWLDSFSERFDLALYRRSKPEAVKTTLGKAVEGSQSAMGVIQLIREAGWHIPPRWPHALAYWLKGLEQGLRARKRKLMRRAR